MKKLEIILGTIILIIYACALFGLVMGIGSNEGNTIPGVLAYYITRVILP